LVCRRIRKQQFIKSGTETSTIMGLFNNLMSKIFAHPASKAPQTAAPAPTAGGLQAAPALAPQPAAASAPSVAAGASTMQSAAKSPAPQTVDVAAVLNGMAKTNPEKLDWRKSLVDLMKLVGMDSSLSARKQLATESQCSGDMNDSSSINVWRYKQVLIKLAENGGKVPAELLS
jgi:hypothetical protein